MGEPTGQTHFGVHTKLIGDANADQGYLTNLNAFLLEQKILLTELNP